MHKSSIDAIHSWFIKIYTTLPNDYLIADLGSYNINGTIKDKLPGKIIGIDLVAGPCVDVIITPGVIPPEHVMRYDALISANAFHYSGDPNEYKSEVLQLLKINGHFVLTMCNSDCKETHTRLPESCRGVDSIRMSLRELVNFWEPEISITRVYVEGHDLVLWGRKI